MWESCCVRYCCSSSAFFHSPPHSSAFSFSLQACYCSLLGLLFFFQITKNMALVFAPRLEDSAATEHHGATWNPYDNNGGTCVAIAGADYCVVAADTRMSTGFSILTRDHSKIHIITEKCVLASSGFQADIRALQKNLDARHQIYQHQHSKQMSCPAMAQLLSNTLYYKRFFPYYAFNVLGGLDSEGKGCVYTYDAVGSYERAGYSSQGSGMQLIMPVLDNQLKSASPLLLPSKELSTPLSETEAVDLIKDTFASAAERDIYTGDGVEICMINKDGIRRETMPLKRD